uniref:Uncharacterized protein n=1 Tax=Meloidogyne enterolobii TaxID=390850 RepID=A0A6V7U5P0_MELEN|nr:unnamed protein product [Meloidogyne enterolobii]
MSEAGATYLFQDNIYDFKLLMIEEFVTGLGAGVMEVVMVMDILDGEENSIGAENMEVEDKMVGKEDGDGDDI